MGRAAQIQAVDEASSGRWEAAIDLAVEYELQLDSFFTDNPEGLQRARRLVQGTFKESSAYIALADGSPVGVVCGSTEGDEHHGYLYYLYVKEGYRRKGIGTQLLCALEQHFAQAGISRLKIAL